MPPHNGKDGRAGRKAARGASHRIKKGPQVKRYVIQADPPSQKYLEGQRALGIGETEAIRALIHSKIRAEGEKEIAAEINEIVQRHIGTIHSELNRISSKDEAKRSGALRSRHAKIIHRLIGCANIFREGALGADDWRVVIRGTLLFLYAAREEPSHWKAFFLEALQIMELKQVAFGPKSYFESAMLAYEALRNGIGPMIENDDFRVLNAVESFPRILGEDRATLLARLREDIISRGI
jgi:hypothetical protein